MDELFKILLETDDATEFFLVLCGIMQSSWLVSRRSDVTVDLNGAHDKQHGYGMKMSITHNLVRLNGNHRTYSRQTTHTFTLYQDHMVVWDMKGQPTIVGLKNIQQAFDRFRQSLSQEALPTTTDSSRVS